MIQLVPVLVCIGGLLAYALSASPKVQEIGRLGFAVGLLVALLSLGPVAVMHLR